MSLPYDRSTWGLLFMAILFVLSMLAIGYSISLPGIQKECNEVDNRRGVSMNQKEASNGKN